MKFIKIFTVTILAVTIANTSFAQIMNWSALQKDQRHTLNVNGGFDFGFTFGVSYAYQLKTSMPILLTAAYSQPAGNTLVDDFKSKIGGQIRVYQFRNFHVSAKAHGIFRRFENSNVRLVNFGTKLSANAGYYRKKWFVAGEFGFDKAIVTNFRHTAQYREYFPDVKDGWYQPATGGNFNYGIQAGFTFGSNDITVKAGEVVQQDRRTYPTLPIYFQIGYNRRL
jgi:hypothetical protein